MEEGLDALRACSGLADPQGFSHVPLAEDLERQELVVLGRPLRGRAPQSRVERIGGRLPRLARAPPPTHQLLGGLLERGREPRREAPLRRGHRQPGGELVAARMRPRAQRAAQLDGAVAEREQRVVVREAGVVPRKGPARRLERGAHADDVGVRVASQQRGQPLDLGKGEPPAEGFVRQHVLEALHRVRLRDERHAVECGALGDAHAPPVARRREAEAGVAP